MIGVNCHKVSLITLNSAKMASAGFLQAYMTDLWNCRVFITLFEAWQSGTEKFLNRNFLSIPMPCWCLRTNCLIWQDLTQN